MDHIHYYRIIVGGSYLPEAKQLMATLTNLLIILFTMSVIVQLVGPEAGVCGTDGLGCRGALSTFVAQDSVYEESGRATMSLTDLVVYNQAGVSLALILGVAGVAAITTGLVFGPNPFAIFAAFMGILFVNLVLIPVQLFAVFPSPINYLFSVGLSFLISWEIISWFKGTGEP